MLTYALKKTPGVPLYEALYRCIRADILAGRLAPNEKLPSKRALAANLEVSKITVEGAYDQLLAEGYIRSVEKVGYFVEPTDTPAGTPRRSADKSIPPDSRDSHRPENPVIDLTANTPISFPFSVWSRLQRQVMLDLPQELLLPLHNQGIFELRRAIAGHLWDFRGLQVEPENILVGAGTDFLYNLLIQLLGRDRIYAVEDPGYGKIRKIYAAGGVACLCVPMDDRGVLPQALGEAQVLHISPSHHFPTGLVTPISRRLELLQWASEADGYIIEDDYDSEFRFDAHPMPAMASLDSQGRVIYMNTFTKTLAPSIRISYMVLPEALMKAFQKKLGFYSCTVPSFEQYTLARFLEQGYYEKHINRMRRAYRALRNRVTTMLRECPLREKLTILEQDAGLHFLLRVDTSLSDRELEQVCRAMGVKVKALSGYYHEPPPEASHKCLVINYSGITEPQLQALQKTLSTLNPHPEGR